MSIRIYNQQEKESIRKSTKNVNHLSVAEIASNLYGLTLFKTKGSGRYLRCYEHPSLTFDLLKNLVFYNAKTTHGMSPYDFVAFYESISFMDARSKLNEYYSVRDPRVLEHYLYNRKMDEVTFHYGLLLPRKLEGEQKEVRRFLLDNGVSQKIIDDLIKESLIYEAEANHNLIAIGYDEKDKPAYAEQLGIQDDYSVECNGSYTKIGFSKVNVASDKLLVASNLLDGLRELSNNPECNLLVAKDILNVNDTLKYAQEHYEWIKNIKEIVLLTKESEYEKSLVNFSDIEKDMKNIAYEIRIINDNDLEEQEEERSI